MDQKSVDNLKEALQFSPENIPLRLHLANTLLAMEQLDEAQSEFEEVAKQTAGESGRDGLAKVFFAKKQYSKSIVVLEELIDHESADIELLVIYTKALLRDHSTDQAIDTYQRILMLSPNFSDEELDGQLRNNASSEEIFDEDELLESPFFQNADISFDQVGGMDEVKKEIEMKIIHPLKHPDLYKAYGKKTGGGILLYGPPGCGKTFLAKATAGQVNSRFMSVGLNDILDMWIGKSEQNLHSVFEVARDHNPCVLFFDEIDALGASRSDMRQSSGRHLINQFLQELDGIDGDNDGVLILGATNTPWHLDTAFRRPGRFDRIIFVPPPDESAREAILKLKLEGKPMETIDFAQVAKKMKDYSGADIEAVIDITIEEKLASSFEDGIPKPIGTKDLLNACKKHKPTTQEWFTTAKNFALYANDSGLYDDILTYMKIKK